MRWCTAILLTLSAAVAMAAEPEPPADPPVGEPVELRPIDLEDMEGFEGLPPEIRDAMLRDFGGPEPAESSEGMEDAARRVLELCFDATSRDEIDGSVDEAYWDYYHQYSHFDADSVLERMVIQALLGDPAFGRGSVARAGAVDLLLLCDDYSNETASKFPTPLVALLAEEFQLREEYEVGYMISTFARRIEPADILLWYSIPADLLRSEDAYTVWRSFDLFEALGVLGTKDEAYLRRIIADPREHAPDLWTQLDESIALRREYGYPDWDRTLFRAEAVATLLAVSRDPDDAIEFLDSLTGRARIDAARGIVDALWEHADHDFVQSLSPFGSEDWTEDRFARLFSVLDAMLLDPRAKLIVGTDFTGSEWGDSEGDWYYDSVVGDLVDLYDSPIETVAERSVVIARLAASMHAGPKAAALVDQWLEENERVDWGDVIPDPDDFMPR